MKCTVARQCTFRRIIVNLNCEWKWSSSEHRTDGCKKKSRKGVTLITLVTSLYFYSSRVQMTQKRKHFQIADQREEPDDAQPQQLFTPVEPHPQQYQTKTFLDITETVLSGICRGEGFHCFPQWLPEQTKIAGCLFCECAQIDILSHHWEIFTTQKGWPHSFATQCILLA